MQKTFSSRRSSYARRRRVLLPVGRAIQPTTGEFAFHFPDTLCTLIDFAYTLQLLSVASSRGLWQHGRVFTPGPSLGNPYTIQFSRYSREYSTLDVEN